MYPPAMFDDEPEPLPPTIRSKLIEWLGSQERPARISEIAAAIDLPTQSLTAVLHRAVKARLIRRFKAPITSPYQRHPAPHSRTCKLWLYQAENRP